MALTAAVGSIDITPEHPPFPSLWMGGYGWSPRGNHGEVARRLLAHCLVLWDDGVPHVLVRADVISIPRDVHQHIRATVVGEGLVADSAFMMSSSHTHSGAFLGDTRPDPRITMNLNDADVDAVNGSTWIVIERLLDLVRATLAMPRTDVTLGYGETQVNLGYNRAGLPTVLNTVPVLLLRRTSDRHGKFAVLFGAACHPVARGNDSTFDSDYAGAAAEAIEERLGIPALFFQGTAGDQEPHHPHNPEQVSALGSQLAEGVVRRIHAGHLTPVRGPITTRLTEVALPFAIDTSDPAVLANLRARYQQRSDEFPTADVRRRHADRMIAMIDAGEMPTHMPMPIQVWRFAGLSVVGLAHEVLSAYHVRLRRRTTGRLWIMGYANEVEGYVPDDEALWAGGYEAGASADDPGIAGEFGATMPYAWPCALKASDEGVRPAAPGTTERIVVDAAIKLLRT